MIGAVKGVDPRTGQHYDDTRRYVDATPNLSDAARADVFAANHLTVYPRLEASVAAQSED
jgi:4-oxalmesaconate hydratase